VLVSVWSATTVSATGVVIAIAGGSHAARTPPTAVIGAVVGALIALIPALQTTWWKSRNGVNPHSESP
jgi:hypothetical protein